MLLTSLHPSRRALLKLAAASALLPRLATPALAQEDRPPFSFDALSEEMKAAAAQPWEPAAAPEGWWGELDYDGYRKIRFRDRRARWRDGDDDWRLMAFHMGWLFPEPVRLFDVTDGTAQELAFTTDDFDYGRDLREQVPLHGELPGVAGFKLNWPLNAPDRMDEVVSFVGASYFRALGAGNVYGASARGVALNTGTSVPEEFPRFSRFYVARSDETATIHAALEGPSVMGAYRFVLRPGPVTEMEVTARLYFRAAVEELGVAPLTSMFLFAGQNRQAFDDYRPNVHDSDGLRILRADGQTVWRPLNNPARLASSYFKLNSPRSFGLLQRERDFDSYQDPGARYDRRPSIEIVPQGDWGPGAVRLVEIPTDLEANDNIVAFWVPEQKVAPGDAREFAYTLRWGDLSPDPAGRLAVVHETRAGTGGVSGTEGIENARKFAVDFRGGRLGALGAEAKVEPVVTVSSGHVLTSTVEKLPVNGDWRVVLDVAAEPGAVVELTLHVAGYGERLTETWAYQWMNA
ncbi:glucan biosynthesis protein [Rubellimicrobium aerolatum]|uniref:Glucan biosynthesis protein n=1 Tax=Rubellimicrobium aerolatum TaxID=490979 RepID=A0ABW0S9F5_9RHOB|nr:glucan biosynthesis protein [Rubellimicrobium aerolatum]MBP1804871.1 glucans biosynthesis protein [Rubellimicrobium aerolatum]